MTFPEKKKRDVIRKCYFDIDSFLLSDKSNTRKAQKLIRDYNNHLVFVGMPLFRFVNYFFITRQCFYMNLKNGASVIADLTLRDEARNLCNEIGILLNIQIALVRELYGMDKEQTKYCFDFLRYVKREYPTEKLLISFRESIKKYIDSEESKFIVEFLRNKSVHSFTPLGEMNERTFVDSQNKKRIGYSFQINEDDILASIKSCLKMLLEINTKMQALIDNKNRKISEQTK